MMMRIMIIIGGRVVVDGCTNGASGLDDGRPADGGRCGHPRFIENDCDDDYDTMMMMTMMAALLMGGVAVTMD